MLVSAHNAHIQRDKYGPSLGMYLARAHDVDYLPIAQLLHEGRYNGQTNGSAVTIDSAPSYPGTLEYALHCTGAPRLALDMRVLATDDPASSWLLGDMVLREIWTYLTPGWKQMGTLTSNFDAIVFFDQTTPSRLLAYAPNM